MNVGIFLGDVKADLGGNYTFQHSIVSSLYHLETEHVLYMFHYGDMHNRPAHPPNIRYVRLDRKTPAHILNATFSRIVTVFGKKWPYSLLSTTAESYHIDIMWFVTHSFELVHIPYICTVLDLEHRVHPFFPEVSVSGSSWDNREELFKTMIPRAAYVISGTEAGKHEILKFYHPDPERVRVIPFPVPSQVRVCKQTATNGRMDRPYLFYPAQFWPHKNHIVLLHAVKLLRDTHGLYIDLVFCGSDKGNLSYVREAAKQLGLDNHVHFLGFVSTDELYTLYKNAFALTYPSLFGPDNLPPLEAFALGCPVIAANVAGAAEQMGDAALMIDPLSEKEIAAAVMKLHIDPELRLKLMEKGEQRVKRLTSSAYVKKIVALCDEFEHYRRCWSRNEKYVQL